MALSSSLPLILILSLSRPLSLLESLSVAGEDLRGDDTEELLDASGPEEDDHGEHADEGDGELEGINDTRSVPLSDADGDEVEEGRKDVPEGVADAEDEVEELLLELGLVSEGHVEGVGKVGVDTEPAEEDVDNDKAEEGAAGVDELGGGGVGAGGAGADEEDEVEEGVGGGDVKDDDLTGEHVVGDGPAGGDHDEEEGKEDGGEAAEELAEDAAAGAASAVLLVVGPVDEDEHDREGDEDEADGEDLDDGVEGATHPEEVAGDDLDAGEDEEEDKVDGVEGEHAHLVKAKVRVVDVLEGDGVLEVELLVLLGGGVGAVERGDVPDVGAHVVLGVVVGLLGGSHLAVHRGDLQLLIAGEALVLLDRAPAVLDVKVHGIVSPLRGVLGGSLLDGDPSLVRGMGLLGLGEAETPEEGDLVLGLEVALDDIGVSTVEDGEEEEESADEVLVEHLLTYFVEVFFFMFFCSI